MRKVIAIALCLLPLGWCLAQTVSPQVISTAGDYSVGSNGSLSWTIGETITETYSNGSNILTQGFQQDTTIIVKIQDIAIDFNVSVYPNPTNSYLTIEVLSPLTKTVKLELFDMQGRAVHAESLTPAATNQPVKKQVDITRFAAADYLLNISSSGGQVIKSYKIIKR